MAYTRKLLALLSLIAVAYAPPARALGAEQFERILLPITIAPTRGAFGSVWMTDIWYRSDADTPVQVFPLIVSDGFPGPHVTVPLQVVLFSPGHPPGQFIYVTRSAADQVHLSLRVFDSSRDSSNFGTELPAVREEAFTQGSVTLLNVPADARFRVMLRIYESALEGRGRARVDVFEQSRDMLLLSETVDLPAPFPFTFNPGYAQLALANLGRASDRFRVVITPLTDGANIWAFASVTNNDTQQVTIVTPQ